MINSSLTAAYRTMKLFDTVSGCHMSKKNQISQTLVSSHMGGAYSTAVFWTKGYNIGDKNDIFCTFYVEGCLIHK